MKALNIGGLKVQFPIIQGGMGVGISLSGLASAVANEGGIGVISAAGLGMLRQGKTKDFLLNNIHGLQDEIRRAKQLSTGIIGVNIMVALTNFADLVRTAIDEEIDIIFAGAGLPLDLPKYLKPGSRTKLVPIVSSARTASLICQKWWGHFACLPDAIVVEGPKAGGHLGFKPNQIEDEDFALEKLIPEVLKVTADLEKKYGRTIPVIAAGGIYSGADIARFLDMGASGVQMGTRFVTTFECDASESFKTEYLNAEIKDIRIIQSPVGMPGRAINSAFLNDVVAGKRHPKSCPVNCIHTCDIKTAPYCIMASLTSALRGNFQRGYAFAGSNVWRTNKIVAVKELMQTLRLEYEIYNVKKQLTNNRIKLFAVKNVKDHKIKLATHCK